MRRRGGWLWGVVVALVVVACTDDGGEEATPTTAPGPATTTEPADTTAAAGAATTAAAANAPATTAAASPATTAAAGAGAAATARIEPNAIAGLPRGSNKSAAYERFGNPNASGQDTDRAGASYEFLRWELSGNRGLTLYYRALGVTSPLLTHWQVTAPGPATARGIKVGDPASAAVAAYGPLEPSCCGALMVSVTEGGGKLVLLMDPAGTVVHQILGGTESSWTPLIAS